MRFVEVYLVEQSGEGVEAMMGGWVEGGDLPFASLFCSFPLILIPPSLYELKRR